LRVYKKEYMKLKVYISKLIDSYLSASLSDWKPLMEWSDRWSHFGLTHQQISWVNQFSHLYYTNI
jgi:hypothetical protein